MRKLSILAFDDFVTSSTVVYTTQALNETLGAFDKLTIQAVCDSLSTTPTVSVAIEHSGDQRTWLAKNGTPEISAFGPTTAAPSKVGGDTSSTGSMGFVRLSITLGGTTPSMHLKLWVTARDTVA